MYRGRPQAARRHRRRIRARRRRDPLQHLRHRKHLLLSAADVFVSPSNTVSESFGLSLVEATLHALPIVCTAWNGYREIVRDGIDGFLIDVTWRAGSAEGEIDLPFVLGFKTALQQETAVDIGHLADRLGELVRDGELRWRLGQAAQARARSCFMIDRAVVDIVRLMKAALGAEPHTPPERHAVSVARAFAAYASRPGIAGTQLQPDPDGHITRSQTPIADNGYRELLARIARGESVNANDPDVFECLRRGLVRTGRPEAS